MALEDSLRDTCGGASKFRASPSRRREQGYVDAARDLLAPTYGWLAEGFDTADLKGAKALLDELS